MAPLYTVGYIGLGLMGKSIARNILKEGFPLIVHNRSRVQWQSWCRKGLRKRILLPRLRLDPKLSLRTCQIPLTFWMLCLDQAVYTKLPALEWWS